MKQPKLWEYLNKNKSSFDASKKPPGLPGTRAPDPTSREASDAGTQKLSDDFVFQGHENRDVCPIFWLITPQDLTNFSSTQAKLDALSKKQPSKGEILTFIREQAKMKTGITKIESVDMKNLQNITSAKFWDKAVPHLVRRAAEKKLKPIRLLAQKSTSVVTISRGDAFTILSHMFLCTLPEQFYRKDTCFNEYFNGAGYKSSNRYQKLQCIVAYFQAMLDFTPSQFQDNIIFQRVSNSSKAYMQAAVKMSNVAISYRNIEEYKGQLMVDFANKHLGGGVLKNGCVQEEIMFVTHPELLLCCLLYENFGDSECALVHGCYQYSKYEGYSGSFKFKGAYNQRSNIDTFDKHHNTYVIIDAVNFNEGVFKNTPGAQYRQGHINRQIHKAYLGFSCGEYIDQPNSKKKIITGKWGCGAFGGDPELKLVIQWLAASWASRDMVFVNWGEQEANKTKDSNFQELIDLLKDMNTSSVRRMLKRYLDFRTSEKVNMGLSDYVAEFFF